jgi:23S rRNA pseudouridine1911/1915/1917 synthase
MKDVPFYANHEDGMHCMLAAYKSLFDYFLHRKLSWDELEKLSGYQNGRAAWTLKILTYMAERGWNIRMIEPFDYKRYLKEGEPYLYEVFSDEEQEWIYANSNILDIRPLIIPFLEHVSPEIRSASLEDIDTMLAEGRLVFVTLNAQLLNDQEGYVSHAILITGKEGDDYIAHDSGGKYKAPEANRRISAAKLWEAMGGEGNRAEVTGFKLGPTHGKKRLDVYVAEQLPKVSRAFAARLCDQGKVLVNGATAKPGHRLRKNDVIQINYDETELDNIPSIDLPIIYEDDDCVVINKPAGVLTHAQGAMSVEATVASFLRDKLHDLSGQRGGIVHRLDRATSGVIIGAKNPEALSKLQQQFADREVKKTYIAIAEGHLAEAEALIDMPIERNPKAPATFRAGPNGKPSTTYYKVLQETSKYSLIELRPTTGRTHQLRVHLAQIGHPIIGDSLYGGGTHGDRLFLHAKSLEITLPNGERKTFTAPLPPEFAELLQ